MSSPGRALLHHLEIFIDKNIAIPLCLKIYALLSQVFLGSVDGCRMDQELHRSPLRHWAVLPWEVWLTASDSSIDQQGSALL